MGGVTFKNKTNKQTKKQSPTKKKPNQTKKAQKTNKQNPPTTTKKPAHYQVPFFCKTYDQMKTKKKNICLVRRRKPSSF